MAHGNRTASKQDLRREPGGCTQLTIDISLSQFKKRGASNQQEQEKILIKRQRIDLSEDGSLKLGPVLDRLSAMGLEINECDVWYFSDWSMNFVHVGRYPSC